ncbi:hypothetical protein ACGLWX_13405 [Halomonas sp. HMF6819]|uniref:hypothetical protein n=1 Tax=Halomonas sp. HMF6819 TaxID=3373085 RepID=UPI00379B2FCA
MSTLIHRNIPDAWGQNLYRNDPALTWLLNIYLSSSRWRTTPKPLMLWWRFSKRRDKQRTGNQPRDIKRANTAEGGNPWLS